MCIIVAPSGAQVIRMYVFSCICPQLSNSSKILHLHLAHSYLKEVLNVKKQPERALNTLSCHCFDIICLTYFNNESLGQE